MIVRRYSQDNGASARIVVACSRRPAAWPAIIRCGRGPDSGRCAQLPRFLSLEFTTTPQRRSYLSRSVSPPLEISVTKVQSRALKHTLSIQITYGNSPVKKHEQFPRKEGKNELDPERSPRRKVSLHCDFMQRYSNVGNKSLCIPYFYTEFRHFRPWTGDGYF